MDATTRWYDTNADDYVHRTAHLDNFPGLEAELGEFVSLLPSGGLILDVGSGGGRDVEFMALRGFRMVALDLSAKLLGECLRRNAGETVAGLMGDARRIPLSDCSIDGIWASASLLHLTRKDIPIALNEVRRVLKSGSPLGLSMKMAPDSNRPGDGRQFTYTSENEMREWMSASNFEVLSVTGPMRNGWLNVTATRLH